MALDMELQVLVVAVRNRNLKIPENPDELFEVHDQESASGAECIPRTKQFRWDYFHLVYRLVSHLKLELFKISVTLKKNDD